MTDIPFHAERRDDYRNNWRTIHTPSGFAADPAASGTFAGFYTEDGALAFGRWLAEQPGDWSTKDGALAAIKALGGVPALRNKRDELDDADRDGYFTEQPPEWPDESGGVTADRLARTLVGSTATLGARCAKAMDEFCSVGRDNPAHRDLMRKSLDASAGYTGEWSALYLLRALIEHAPHVADETAQELVAILNAGDDLGELEWDWAEEYGIDPKVLHAKAKADVEARAENAGSAA